MACRLEGLCFPVYSVKVLATGRTVVNGHLRQRTVSPFWTVVVGRSGGQWLVWFHVDWFCGCLFICLRCSGRDDVSIGRLRLTFLPVVDARG